MFREVARVKQRLTHGECVDVLCCEPRGVLAVLGDDGYPYAVPTNHWYDTERGVLYFHSGMKGHKIDAIRRCSKVSYCVTDKGTRKDGDWALTYRSVIVFGQVQILTDQARAIEVTRRLSLQFTEDLAYIEQEIESAGTRTLVFALVPEHITGKTVHEA